MFHGLEAHTLYAFIRKFGLHCIRMSLSGMLVSTGAHLNLQNSLSQVVEAAPLPNLRHLAIGTRVDFPLKLNFPPIWSAIISLTHSWSCPLQSVVFKLNDRRMVGGRFIEDLITSHGDTLKSLSFPNCDMDPDTLKRIAEFCPCLKNLAVHIPRKYSVSNYYLLRKQTLRDINFQSANSDKLCLLL